MKGHGSKFGRKKEEAIAALLTQQSVEDAARVSVGTGAGQTLLRWLQIDRSSLPAIAGLRRDAFGTGFTARLAAGGVRRRSFDRPHEVDGGFEHAGIRPRCEPPISSCWIVRPGATEIEDTSKRLLRADWSGPRKPRSRGILGNR